MGLCLHLCSNIRLLFIPVRNVQENYPGETSPPSWYTTATESASGRVCKSQTLLVMAIGRPLHMLFTEPIVIAFGIYVSFNFAILYSFFAAFPAVFEGIYGFNTGESGLVFIAIAVGNVIGYSVFLLIDRLTFRPLVLAAKARGDAAAIASEARLYSALLGIFLLPIALFWFAWTARPSIHWICPVIASVPF
jgi:hypothetical protein